MTTQNKRMRIKELSIDDETGIDAIALVEMPAVEIDFMYFNNTKENITLAKVNEDKQIITGPAMIPDKMIYRYDPQTNEDYYVYFTKETVDRISQRYLIEQKQSSVNLEHELPISNVTLVESWIVTDPENDKAKALGFTVPKGTWMTSMKVNDKEIWDNLIKTKTVKGFSIEGYFISKYSKETPTDEITLQKIKDLISQIDE